MKKSMIMSLLLVLCMIFALTGCGGSKNNESKADSNAESKTESNAESKTESNAENKTGSEAESNAESNACEFNCPGTGYGFDLPENVKFTKGFLDIYDLGDVDYDSGVMMGWPLYFDMTEEEYNELTDENADQLHVGFSFQIICVKDVNSEDEAKAKILTVVSDPEDADAEAEKEAIEEMRLIHQEDGYVWLAYYNEKNEEVREECREEYNAFYDSSEQIISSMKFYPPEVWKGADEGTDLSFETLDLAGNPVNSKALFAKNKVTMINIWATTCGPCIDEMAELEAMDKEFKQKGGAIVGLVDDVKVSNSKYLDEALAILSDTGVTYTNLRAWDGYEAVLSHVGTPTTYFVDSQGRLIGDPILGADPARYKAKMEEYLSKAE